MSYSIIGFGNIGRALAKAFSRKGIEVSVATTRDPESFAADAAAIGSKVIAKTLAEAVKADIIFLAVRGTKFNHSPFSPLMFTPKLK